MIKRFVLISFLMISLAASSQAKSLFIGKPQQNALEVALAFLHNYLPSGDEEGSPMITLTQERVMCISEMKCQSQVMVTVMIDGLADDSIRAEKYALTLDKTVQNSWKVINQEKSVACREGRGHTDFSNIPCL